MWENLTLKPEPDPKILDKDEDGLAVDFLDGDTTRRVHFQMNRLGLTFDNAMPLVVKRV